MASASLSSINPLRRKESEDWSLQLVRKAWVCGSVSLVIQSIESSVMRTGICFVSEFRSRNQTDWNTNAQRCNDRDGKSNLIGRVEYHEAWDRFVSEFGSVDQTKWNTTQTRRDVLTETESVVQSIESSITRRIEIISFRSLNRFIGQTETQIRRD